MSSSISPGLTEHLGEPSWLDGPHGPLAFFPYPAERPWLHVLISHGFGEHSGWWAHVAKALQARGVSAYLFDQYHHARSARDAADAGDVPDYAHLVGGLTTALSKGVAPYRKEAGDTASEAAPLVLLAHSNGALVALLSLPQPELEEVRGLVLASPFLEMPPRLRYGGVLLAHLLKLLGKQRRVPLANRPWRLTGCEAIWPQYGQDPRRLSTITVRFFLAMRRAVRRASAVRDLGGRALLMLTAGREEVVSPTAQRAFYERVLTPDKAQRHYPGLRHELFNEAAWEIVLRDVVDWCRSRFTGEPNAEAQSDLDEEPEEPLRVLHLDLERGWRGGQQQIAYLLAYLREQGVESWLACRAEDALHRRAETEGHRVVPLAGVLRAVPALVRLARREGIHILHAHSSRAHTVGLLVRVFCPGLRLVVSRRVVYHRRPGWLSAWKYHTGLVSRWLAISRSVRDVLIADGVPDDRIAVIYSGIDPERCATPLEASRSAALRTELGLPPDALIVGAVGALTPDKDPLTLLRAFAEAAQSRPHLHLLWIGDGPLRGELDTLAMELGVDGRVHLPGFREDVPMLLHLLDIYALSSLVEGLGTSVLDAMSAGRPVVVTAAGGVVEAVAEGRAGFVVPVGDAEAMAGALGRLADDPALRAACGAAALEDVRRFSAEATGAGTLAEYRALG